MQTISDNLSILISDIMTIIPEEESIRSAYNFINKYSDDINSGSTRQILSLKIFLIYNFECEDLKKIDYSKTSRIYK